MGSELLPLEEGKTILRMHSLSGDSLRVIPQEHVGKVSAVVDSLLGRLADIVPWKRLGNGLEAGLMEVGESETIAGVQADLMRGRGQIGVGDVLHDITGEDCEDVGNRGHVVPPVVLLCHSS